MSYTTSKYILQESQCDDIRILWIETDKQNGDRMIVAFRNVLYKGENYEQVVKDPKSDNKLFVKPCVLDIITSNICSYH